MDEEKRHTIPATTLRREKAAQHAIPCPKCGTDQVQLMQYFRDPLLWRCRYCRHKYHHGNLDVPIEP